MTQKDSLPGGRGRRSLAIRAGVKECGVGRRSEDPRKTLNVP
jgi:hypothetical protein